MLYRDHNLEYGGSLYKKRAGRDGPRPLVGNRADSSIHETLRSTQAKGTWSLRRHHGAVCGIIERFAKKFHVHLIRYAVNYNHIHLNFDVPSRKAYVRFIRAISGAIAMAVTGASRLKPLLKKFWDLRPWSRVVEGNDDHDTVLRYLRINQLEGEGYSRKQAIRKIGREGYR
jgi:hypothetical protein